MTRILSIIATTLLFLVTFAASIMWPGPVVWVAWMIAALLWWSNGVLEGEVEEARASRDRCLVEAGKMRGEVHRLERKLAYKQADLADLQGALRGLAELVEAGEGEIGRLRGIAYGPHASGGELEKAESEEA